MEALSDRTARMFSSEGSTLMTTFPFPADCSFSLSSEYWVRLGFPVESLWYLLLLRLLSWLSTEKRRLFEEETLSKLVFAVISGN